MNPEHSGRGKSVRLGRAASCMSARDKLFGVSKSRGLRQRIFIAIGAALLIAGIITFAVSGPSSVGWFAYAPLAEESGPSTIILWPSPTWGLALGFVGSVILSGLLGFHLGLRRGH